MNAVSFFFVRLADISKLLERKNGKHFLRRVDNLSVNDIVLNIKTDEFDEFRFGVPVLNVSSLSLDLETRSTPFTESVKVWNSCFAPQASRILIPFTEEMLHLFSISDGRHRFTALFKQFGHTQNFLQSVAVIRITRFLDPSESKHFSFMQSARRPHVRESIFDLLVCLPPPPKIKNMRNIVREQVDASKVFKSKTQRMPATAKRQFLSTIVDLHMSLFDNVRSIFDSKRSLLIFSTDLIAKNKMRRFSLFFKETSQYIGFIKTAHQLFTPSEYVLRQGCQLFGILLITTIAEMCDSLERYEPADCICEITSCLWKCLGKAADTQKQGFPMALVLPKLLPLHSILHLVPFVHLLENTDNDNGKEAVYTALCTRLVSEWNQHKNQCDAFTEVITHLPTTLDELNAVKEAFDASIIREKSVDSPSSQPSAPCITADQSRRDVTVAQELLSAILLKASDTRDTATSSEHNAEQADAQIEDVPLNEGKIPSVPEVEDQSRDVFRSPEKTKRNNSRELRRDVQSRELVDSPDVLENDQAPSHKATVSDSVAIEPRRTSRKQKAPERFSSDEAWSTKRRKTSHVRAATSSQIKRRPKVANSKPFVPSRRVECAIKCLSFATTLVDHTLTLSKSTTEPWFYSNLQRPTDSSRQNAVVFIGLKELSSFDALITNISDMFIVRALVFLNRNSNDMDQFSFLVDTPFSFVRNICVTPDESWRPGDTSDLKEAVIFESRDFEGPVSAVYRSNGEDVELSLVQHVLKSFSVDVHHVFDIGLNTFSVLKALRPKLESVYFYRDQGEAGVHTFEPQLNILRDYVCEKLCKCGGHSFLNADQEADVNIYDDRSGSLQAREFTTRLFEHDQVPVAGLHKHASVEIRKSIGKRDDILMSDEELCKSSYDRVGRTLHMGLYIRKENLEALLKTNKKEIDLIYPSSFLVDISTAHRDLDNASSNFELRELFVAGITHRPYSFFFENASLATSVNEKKDLAAVSFDPQYCIEEYLGELEDKGIKGMHKWLPIILRLKLNVMRATRKDWVQCPACGAVELFADYGNHYVHYA